MLICGFIILKLFLSGVFGILFMKNLVGFFFQVIFILIGGIYLLEVLNWFKVGVGVVGVGS